MPLGSKRDYCYLSNLRPSRLLNVLKGIRAKKNGRLDYYPRRYSIEPATICTLQCRHCFHWRYDKDVHLKRERMTFENFKVILNKVKKYALLMEFYNFGEPFLNRETPRMIAAATGAGIRSRISSNMNAPIDDAYAREIVASGLYRLTCSIDGPTQEIYEKYRIGGNLQVALENAGRIIRHKKKTGARYPVIVFRMLVFEWNHQHIDDCRRLAAEHGFDEFYADPGVYTVEGAKASWDIKNKCWNKSKPRFTDTVRHKAKVPCEWLFHGMVINANGNVMPCCFADVQKAEHLSLLTHTLDEVWNSEQYINTRRYTLGISNDRSNILPLCATCSSL